jgi:hypothetical protein
LASAAGVTIEHIAKKHIRKEDVVAKILAVRGDHPGLVHIISAMEACNTYKPWHDKQTHRTFLRPDTGKCLHYYFYFIDAELGLIYLRVPTWCPFRLQFYCNGPSWLARQLTAAGIGFTLADNAFLRIDDWERAHTLANGLSPDMLHRSVRPAVLSGGRRVRSVLPLEFHAGRVRHGSRVPIANHPQTPLSTAFPAGHPHCQSRTRRHLPRPQDHCPTHPRDRQSIRNADRGDLRQASFRQILDQDL